MKAESPTGHCWQFPESVNKNTFITGKECPLLSKIYIPITTEAFTEAGSLRSRNPAELQRSWESTAGLRNVSLEENVGEGDYVPSTVPGRERNNTCQQTNKNLSSKKSMHFSEEDREQPR